MRHRLLLAAALVSSLFLSFGPPARAATASRTLTFRERVAAQRAIEEVYHRHRIGERRAFGAAVTSSILERKVRAALAKSAALARRWKLPITDDLLQAELDRIRAHTRRPEMLRELETALGNDEALLRETLARSTLVERLDRSPAAGEALDALFSTAGASAEALADPLPESCRGIGEWTPLPELNAPSPRHSATAVWTGAELIIWGGRFPASGNGLRTGARYDPTTDSWRPTSLPGAPDARYQHTAVWTGSQMIVWGGNPGQLDTGGRYDPATDIWWQMSGASAPTGRVNHQAIWTGTEMIVWGGAPQFSASGTSTGGRYDPVLDRWRAISQAGVPAGRFWHTTIWTGSEMVVWGGTVRSGTSPLDSGGRYDPVADSWRPTALSNAPAAREFAAAVWTGLEMIVWGGSVNLIGPAGDGGRYDPVLDAWSPLSSDGAPQERAGHIAAWTGRLMAVWGGNTPPSGPVDTGGLYDPAADAWRDITTDGAPSPRQWHAAAIAGDDLIVFGGYDGAGVLGDGGRYRLDSSPDDDGDGSTICGGDCDDANPGISPGAVERPGNGVDEDCDGVVACDPASEWDSPGAFRVCIVRTCRELERQGRTTPPQCRQGLVPRVATD